MSDKPTSVMKRRLNLGVTSIMLAVIIYIIINMVSASINDAAQWQALASAQQLKSRVITAPRGAIYDSNMQILAQSATVYTIYVDPVMLKTYLNEKDCKLTLDDIVHKLSELLEMDEQTIREKCQMENQYQEIKKNVEKPVADKLREYTAEYELVAVAAAESSKRFYPENSLAASVVGHLHYDGYGIYGLEAYYNEYLSGTNGKTLIAADNRGNEIPYKYKQSYEAKQGDSLVLNLDITIQSSLENALKETVEENMPNERACGIIMNPKTGAIYAMATTYGYDLNNPTEILDPKLAQTINSITNKDTKQTETSKAWARQWKNKAVSEIYFPGSVFKVITASAALEEQTISLNDTFNCGMAYNVAGTTFHCWAEYDHHAQNLNTAMMNSCNPAFIRIGQTLGANLFSQYFKSFGLTEVTGIDLPGEAESLYVAESRMGPVELASSAFGQTNKITAIEMITAYAAVVNGGYLVTPQVVDKIIDTNGNVVKDIEPVTKRQVISEETSKKMQEVLKYTVENAKSGNSYIQGYSIGGKSGTSQKIDIDNTGHTYVASYCAFAPAEDPEVIVLVLVDDPTGKNFYGSLVAAPTVTKILKDILPYMGIYPEYSGEELEQIPVSVPNTEDKDVADAKNTLEALGLTVKTVGDGKTVIKQMPSEGQMKRGGEVVLYTEAGYVENTVTVPNLSGMTLEQAKSTLAELGLNFLPDGSAAYSAGATAGYNQNYAAGTVVAEGTVISVTFFAKNVTSQ